MSDKNQSNQIKEFTANAAAGSLEDVVALPWLLHLPPAAGQPHSSAVVTHREHETEQSWRLRLRGAGPSFHGLPLLSSPTLSPPLKTH